MEAEKCKECGSDDTIWHCGKENNSGVVDGRLTMHDVTPIFYLGCEACSSTLKIISGDKAAESLKELALLRDAAEVTKEYIGMKKRGTWK